MSTNSETINQSWQKTLTGGFEFDEELLGNPDYQEETIKKLSRRNFAPVGNGKINAPR